MMFAKFLVFSALLVRQTMSSQLRTSSPGDRRLSEELIAGYEPLTLVTDKNAIDLDQETIVAYMDNSNFNIAQTIYNNGGHSHSFATLTLNTSLTQDIEPGTKLEVVDTDGVKIAGRALGLAAVPATKVNFEYGISSNQDSFVGCQVGALPSADQVTRFCLPESGFLNVAFRSGINYSYDPAKDNRNARTLAGFSTTAQETMVDCGLRCPYETYDKYYTYYGAYDYGHTFVESAFEMGSTQGFKNGNNDFSQLSDIAKAGTCFVKNNILSRFYSLVIIFVPCIDLMLFFSNRDYQERNRLFERLHVHYS